MRKERKVIGKMKKGRVSRIGSYAIASSMRMRDQRQQPCITCTTFNILAPIYKRLNHNSRESDYRAYWLPRNQRILDSLLRERSSIICLQEFWMGNEELVEMYERRLDNAGYVLFKLPRTNNRGDGDFFLGEANLFYMQVAPLFQPRTKFKSCQPFATVRIGEIENLIVSMLCGAHVTWIQNVFLRYPSFNLTLSFLDIAGLLTAVRKDYLRVINYREFLFNDCGNRVAQLLHVELAAPFSQCRNSDICQEILIVNTHLLFPHDSSLCVVRLNQVYKILQYVECYQKEHKLNPIPILLCGDWNGSKRGHVYKFLRSQGFVSTYDTAHQYTDADAHKWVSHRNHRGNICGVDFIWLLNPNRYRKLLKASWSEAVFGMFRFLLQRASLTEDNAFAFLKADNDGDCITYSGFCEALRQLNLTGHGHGLSVEEIKDLWVQADVNGNGLVHYKEFQQEIWKPTRSEQRDESSADAQEGILKVRKEQTIGFSVENAVLFPHEVEKGRWPEHYSLSDHARLTVVFSPIRMPCSQSIS